MEQCPICRGPAERNSASAPLINGDYAFFSCARCGEFGLTGTAEATLNGSHSGDDISVARLSFMVRQQQDNLPWPVINSDTCELACKEGVLPNPSQQADILIRWLGKNVLPGDEVWVTAETHQGILGSVKPAGVDFVLASLIELGLLEGTLRRGLGQRGLGALVTLTMRGWERFDELRVGSPSGRVAFMAMKFGDEELDALVEDHIKPAVDQTDFTLIKLSDRPRAGLIDDRLRVEINASRFLIADLTHANNGAYWEAGYAEGRGKPVIYICKKSIFEEPDGKPHFDTNHHLTVLWDGAQVDDFVAQLKATIRATIPEARQTD